MITKTQILDVYALGLAFLEAGRHHGDWAVTKSGREVAPEDGQAVRFCLVGALERAVFELDGEAESFESLITAVTDHLGEGLPKEKSLCFRDQGYWKASLWWETEGTLPGARRVISDAAHRLSSK